MPAVLVHGVPDTASMWGPLLAELDRDDVVTLALPGFANAVPEGFGATKEEYAAWIAEQVAAIGEPVDLVGHDWGSLLVQRIALTRPELLRSFAMAHGAITESFTWHDLAVQWQTPVIGEQVMEAMAGDVLADALRDLGHPGADAAAAEIDDTMKRCILSLYRSALDIGTEWSPRGSAERPGLALWGRDDPYSPPATGERFAAAVGARLVMLDGGHWAVIQRPVEAAAALEEFWSSLA